MKPVLSIITINYNNREGLKNTIASVLAQSFRGFEYIIIDGGSQDGSVEHIKTNAGRLQYWISEPDNGIYAAMNKGVRRATGDYLFFLNSSDMFYANDVLESVFAKQHEAKLLIGNTVSTCGKRETIFRHNNLSPDWFVDLNVNHQAVFFHRSVFAEFGLYDESLKICADHKLILKTLLETGFRYTYLDQTICRYDTNGLSADPAQLQLIGEEKRNIHLGFFSEQHWAYLKEVRMLRMAYQNMQNSRMVRLGLSLSRSLRRLKNSFH